MESLVNYSSEDEQDDYPYNKVAVRERGSGCVAVSGRTATEVSGPLKRCYEHSKSGVFEAEVSNRKGRDAGNERYKSGMASYNQDKYKIDRRAEKSRDYKEKRGSRELKTNRDVRDNEKSSDYNQKYDKKFDDHKRYREHKREYNHDDNHHYRDDKRYTHHDERRTTYVANTKDRFSNSKSRYDNRKQYDDRFNDEKRATNEERRSSGGSYCEDKRKEFNDRRNGDDRKTDRRYDDRRTQRSYNEDRSNTYRPRRSNSPLSSHLSKGSSKYSERKEDSNTRRERKRHSRSRSRSRSRSAGNSIDSNLPPTNISQPRTALGDHLGEIKNPETESKVSEKKILPTARNFEALLTLPLSENAPKQPNVVMVPATSAPTGINTTNTTVQLPSYYNPNVINPNKYVEQMQKRKLIWGAKKSEDSASKWGHAQFSQDQDGKVASKFMRLMGIKTATGNSSESSTSPKESEKKLQSTSPPNNTDVKTREAMFSTMEQQYEVARQVTHTMRGVGLGFSSQARPY